MAGKSNKRKPPVDIKPEFVKGPEPPRKKKKTKNAPDKPQPAWMFPPDEENPVLNPKPKSEEQRIKDEAARDQAIKFLKYKSVTAPLKAPPPQTLLTLVGAFLTSYGFNNTSRIYTTQLQSRKKLDEWNVEAGVKLPKGFPDLVKIFKEWYKEYEKTRQIDSTSSSSDDDDDSGAVTAKKSKKQAKAGAKARSEAATRVSSQKDETSSSGSSSSSESSGVKNESDVKMEDTSPAGKLAKKGKTGKAKSSSSSSDSDADDEDEKKGAQLQPLKNSTESPANESANKLKRKASSSEASSPGSDSDSKTSQPAEKSTAEEKKAGSSTSGSDTSSPDSDSDEQTPAKIKPQSMEAIAKAAASPSSSSSPSDSESAKEDSKATIATANTTAVASSSSSDTSSSSSDSEELDFAKPPNPTPFTPTVIKTSKSTKQPTTALSDSSETLQATSAQKPSTAQTSLSTSSTSNSDSAAATKETTTTTPTISTSNTKRKHSASPSTKAQKSRNENTPFQRVPKDTLVDPKMASNAYRSYDYADKAHQDLSVTKGRNFTKEKNKKKRGSYRGGAIDVSGGKGVKFDD